MDSRTKDMVAMRERGITLKKIGEKYGVSRERVRQILRDNGIESWRTKEDKRLKEAIIKAEAYIATYPDATWDEVSLHVGVSRQRLQQYGFQKEKAFYIRWTKETAIEAGFAWQRKYGRFPNSFDWQSSGRRMFNDRDEYPCYMTISRLFGGWSAYVMAAEKSVLTSS